MKMPYVLLVGVSLWLGSCRKEVPVEPSCNGSCNVITGRFTTDGRSIGLPNVPLELRWVKRSGQYESAVHRKAKTTTDANGNYNLRFYISDDELKDGIYEVQYQLDRSKYIVSPDSPSKGFSVGGAAIKRDTIITSDWLIPQKAYLRQEITNPTQASEQTMTLASFDAGALATTAVFNSKVDGLWYSTRSPGGVSAIDLEVAANQPVELRVDKYKNGQRIIEHDTINLAPGAHYTQHITY